MKKLRIDHKKTSTTKRQIFAKKSTNFQLLLQKKFVMNLSALPSVAAINYSKSSTCYRKKNNEK